MGRRFGILLCMFVMLAACGGQGYAAVAQMDLAGTSWEVVGVLKASVSGVGSISSFGQSELEFVDASNFNLYDVDSILIFSGTYVIDAKNNVTLTADPDELELFISAMIDDVLMERLEEYDLIDIGTTNIDVQTSKLLAKAKEQSGIMATLSLGMSIKSVATAEVQYPGEDSEEVTSKVTLAFKGTATKNLGSLTDSNWDIPAQESIAIKGAGKVKNDVDLYLELSGKAVGFGSSAAFAADVNGEDSFSGTYINKKNKVTLQSTDLEDYIAVRIMENIADMADVDPGDITDLVVDITRYKASASIKPDVSINCSMVVTFSGELTFMGEEVDFTGSYSLKGKGTPD